MALKFTTFVSYVLGKIVVKFYRFIRCFKEVRENVSIISEQPSYTNTCLEAMTGSNLGLSDPTKMTLP
jgi:hypothetical protein